MTRTTTTLDEGQIIPDVLPTLPDGSDYPYLLFTGNQMHASESVTDLVGALIEGYDAIAQTPDGHDDALWQRYLHGVTVANFVQQTAVAQGTAEGTIDLNTLDEDDLNAALQDRSLPVVDVDEWDHQVPLVLLTTDYEPYGTMRVKPNGNILWIDPSNESLYLESLSNLNIVNFYVHNGGN